MHTLAKCCAVGGLALVLGAGAHALESEADTAVLVHRDGVARGIILKETEKEVTIRTYVGDKTFTLDQIVELRKNLTAQERAAILARVNPSRDEKEARERDLAIAAKRAAPAETPRVIAPAKTERPADAGVILAIRPVEYRGGASGLGTNMPSVEERMLAALDRKISLELVDDDFVESLDLISSLTGINIIISPKVRELKPKITLNVKSMDAANVLKWMTKLTDTHIEVHDAALYITDKPSKQTAVDERTELLLALNRMGADPAVLPPDGQEITETDRLKVAMALFEKEHPKPTDFPGPGVGAFPNDPDSNPILNPFTP